jgi:hypothetical protein
MVILSAMSGKWKIFIWGILSLVMLTLGYFGWRYYRYFSRLPVPAIYAVSNNALFFAEFPDAGLSHRKLIETPLWRSLLDIKTLARFSQQFSTIDSLLLAAEPGISAAMRPFMVSVNLGIDGSVVPVYIMSLPPGDQEKLVSNFIRKVNGIQSIVMQTDYRNTVVNMVNIPAVEKFFHYIVYRGLFIGSFDDEQLKLTVDHLSAGRAISKDTDFQRISQTAGKNVDANVYIRYKNLGVLAEWFASSESLKLMKELRRFGKFGEADLVIHDSSWLFNGYSVTESRGDQLLDCFMHEPQSVRIPAVLPENTAFFCHFGVEKFEKFFADFLKFRSDSTECLGILALLKRNFDISPYDDLISWIGNEFAIAGIESSNGEEPDLVVVIHTLDALKARISLGEVSKKLNKKQNLRPFALKHGDYSIGRINYPLLTGVLFGHLFSGLRENYYVLIKDYVILANNPEVLKKLTDHYYNSKTLDEDNHYRMFSNNIADKSNIYIYGKIPSAIITGAGKLITGFFYDWIIGNQAILSGFEGIAIQFSFVNQMFYTNGYLKFNPAFREPSPFVWRVELEQQVVGVPVLPRNPQTGKRNVLVSDASDHLLLIDHHGRIQWSVNVSEPVQSKVHLIDYFKNGETQFLFNSAGYIHLISMNGHYVDGFPVKLVRNATNGISVFDYNNDREYRLVIGLDDNRTYSFDKSGREVEGFTKIQSRTKVIKPVQHLVADGKDYFFVTDVNGEVIITNRRGEDRISLKKRLEKAENSSFYINQNNTLGMFLTTDQKGNLVYLDASGKTTRSVFRDFSAGHFFLYEDFDGDGNHDFIFIDGKSIMIFDRYKKVIFQDELPEEILTEPVIFQDGKGSKYLGVFLQGRQQVMVFDKKGSVYGHLNLSAGSSFTAASLNNDGHINIITSQGNMVINYRLDQ